VTVLTLDLGTSRTKAALWDEGRLAALTQAPLRTEHPRAGWSEQDPRTWWPAVVAACGELHAQLPKQWRDVRVIGFSAARETFVCVDEDGRFDGPAITWADRRAGAEAAELDREAIHRDTGVIVDAGSPLAKLAWLEHHEPARLRRARWLLAPRDAIVRHMTGRIATDATLAGRAAFVDLKGKPVGRARGRLPDVLASTDVVGGLEQKPAEELALPRGVAVVIGAGDRACEVLGAGATPANPVVSWGTTANLSVPAGDASGPPQATLSPGATGGHVVEFGLSAAGGLLDWLAGLCGTPVADLAQAAARVPAGARGALALPWLNGARAPWWKPGVGAGFVGLTAAHGPGELARALIEGVAFEVAICAELLDRRPTHLTAGGSGATSEAWLASLSGATGLPVRIRRVTQAASAGALVLTAAATGEAVDLDAVNPIVEERPADPAAARYHRELLEQWRSVAEAALGRPGRKTEPNR
jgi:xylulokinase